MSLTDIFRPGTGSRRASAKCDELRDENALLLSQKFTDADRITLLEEDLAAAHRQHLEDEEIAVQQQRHIEQLQTKCDELVEALAALHQRFGPQLAAEANADAITVPPMQRIGADLDTAPLGVDVRPLREAAAAGRLHPRPYTA